MPTRKRFLSTLALSALSPAVFAQQQDSTLEKLEKKDEKVELYRLRIVNRRLGTIQVSSDEGETWHLVGRVTQPSTGASEGYIAAEYAPRGSVAAVAVHGLRIRVSGEDPQLHAPLVLGIAPLELSGDKSNFGYGGHRAGMVGMKTDIPAGTSIFRELAPLPGNLVYLESKTGRLLPLPSDFRPTGQGESLVIPVRAPISQLTELQLENRVGGSVKATFKGGESKTLTHVVKPVLGVGRFDGTSYTGVGRINTAHTGVITVSTAPIDTRLPEGEGKERRGGFQISPVWHNGRTEEHDAPMMLLLGALDANGKPAKRHRELEGTAPLFLDHIGLFGANTVVDCQIDGGEWEPLPVVLGVRLNAFTADGLNELWKAAGTVRTSSHGVTGFRFRFDQPTHKAMYAVALACADRYRQLRLAAARSNNTRVVGGTVTINPTLTDPSRVSYIRLSVDGKVRALKNFAPFMINWDTTRLADGEYFIEVEALDESGAVLATTPQRVYVLNTKPVG